MAIDPIEEKKKSDPYAAYKAMLASGGSFGSKGPAQVTQEVNSGNNTTVENSNDRLNNNHAVSNAEAGAGGAASLIKQTGNAQNSFGQGGQGSQSGNPNRGQAAPSYQDTQNLSPLARAAQGGVNMAPNVMKFVSRTPEERRISTLQESILQQWQTRVGVTPGEDMVALVRGIEDVNQLSKMQHSVATQTHLPRTATEFEETLLASNSDSFQSLG